MRLADIRCVWCNKVLWPFQKLSPGGVMHERCNLYVNQITRENQRQYDEQQWKLRMQEEDRL